MFCVCLEDTLLCSLLVNSGHFWLTSTIVHIYSYFTGGTGGNQAWPPHGFMLVLCQTQEGCFSYFKCSSKGCAMPPTSLKASNIISIESLRIIYHLKCQGTFPTFTQLFEILRIGVHNSRTFLCITNLCIDVLTKVNQQNLTKPNLPLPQSTISNLAQP